MAGLDAQMLNAVGLQPDYVTVLIGGNDVCTDTVGEMTSVADFRVQFEAAMATLTSGSPGTHVYVVSIPDVYQLWSLFKGNFWARFVWSVGDVCQSLLANPTSTQQVDVQRRLEVRQRDIDFNTQLAQVCAVYASRCHFDGNAVFNTPFTTSDVSGDYFHPSIAGQAKLASVSWAAGYAWALSPPPPDAEMWVDGLTATPKASGRTWSATVTVAIVDALGPLSDVTVTGTWSAGSGGTSCVTGAAGTCTLSSSSLNKKTSTVRFTVNDLTLEGWTFVPGPNDSILITKP
jgi:hypothetical protein